MMTSNTAEMSRTATKSKYAARTRQLSRGVRGETASIRLPPSHNYIGAFLTLRCPYSCSYCINRFHGDAGRSYSELPGHKWIDFFNTLEHADVPITLQGGEPGVHPDFIEIVRETAQLRPVDILTNLAFDLREFVHNIDPAWLNRDAPYAPIRASYHPEQFALVDIIERLQLLQMEGFRVGLYGVMHPENVTQMKHAEAVCTDLGIDFRTKPFLGWYEGKLYGDFAYPDACSLSTARECQCQPSELLIAPDGEIYPCHHHLYSEADSRGNIINTQDAISSEARACQHFGHCNPCDVKIKNNRLQHFGHVSVKVTF
jgi:MoaA/NifB/PqqE/SkfB family radical SAM enzyme